VPPECEECDCNCDDDCRDCEICGSSGVCIDDPECGEQDLVWSSPQSWPGYGPTTTNSVGSAPVVVNGPYAVGLNTTIPNQMVAYYDISSKRCAGQTATSTVVRYGPAPGVPGIGGWSISGRAGRCPP
jgi:hypothetical protein